MLKSLLSWRSVRGKTGLFGLASATSDWCVRHGHALRHEAAVFVHAYICNDSLIKRQENIYMTSYWGLPQTLHCPDISTAIVFI